MKKRLIYGSLALSLILGSTTVSAHPGRTDSNGGHTCRTNCSKWGLSNGEYHYHNGGGSSSSGSSSSSSSSQSSSNKNESKPKPKPKPAAPTYKESGLKVYINGKQLSFGSEPLIYQNTNLIPLREIAEGMGATVTWNKSSGSIGIKKGNRKMTLTIGSKTVFYNGTSETASAAPKVIKGVTYVPAQVFARGLGASIKYSESNNTLKITF
ncbi:copper amine oxidase N-terminal domain-containing protein [Paenibacillus sp. Marseille-Q4541]|uniref:copper amine oxidase N-terminal domain-containing protein n=1 Tax=Paenibacillus sp. Marseille-Q4541 TaxID=2831522 RepID=UPI001BA9061B|nr:copper amine oxidase N-terminal domain-containing protein [Paenibacillus sp. Marseille-Q4541]